MKNELRTCYVGGYPALFHRWSDESEARCVRGGITNNASERIVELRTTMGIVEFEDGTVEKVSVEKIRFCDCKMNDFAFPPLKELTNLNKENKK